ncbi:exosortase C-terminal domain/associated protein EpsI [Ideonella sp. BN130291]|uniref:exosortase C-terminal domain/associated protein EpsI n=1 Tax=Ideonella sp. BN130291 TaxID=3112940 RepID=UPI002E275B08|nr:EpsI family protein [Ideonella sp. BN130291]
MNLDRRLALGLGAGMGLAALMAQWARPVADPARDMTTLDTLFPRRFGPWHTDAGAELFVRPARQEGRHLGIYDQVLERTYVDAQGRRIMLLAAEGSEQSAGLQLHRPEVCYPGNGFRVAGLRKVTLPLSDRSLPGTRLHASLPGRSEPITYWTVLGGEAVADDTAFRLRQLRFGLRGRLLDGMLVRLSTITPDVEQAYALHARFAAELASALSPDVRARVVGA